MKIKIFEDIQIKLGVPLFGFLEDDVSFLQTGAVESVNEDGSEAACEGGGIYQILRQPAESWSELMEAKIARDMALQAKIR
jgi:hypothetical protein